MRTLLAIVIALICGAGVAPAQANADFPNRTVRLIVPFPAGGPTDIAARVVAQQLSEGWGQPVVIENRPGGDTIIGAQAVARAEPDGYTLLVAADSTLTMNQFTHKDLPYEPFKDFAPISLLFKNTTLMVGRADGPASVAELIAKARANAGKMNYGAGLPSNRLAGYLFVEKTGIDVQFIPYKGGGDIVTALLNGSIDFSFDSVAANLPSIQAGKVRALARVSHTVPLPALPDLPSLKDAAGLRDFEDISTWGALVAPENTPQAVIDKVQKDVARVLSVASVIDRLRAAGIGPASANPSELAALMRADASRWQAALGTRRLRLD
jgi:tripartite-type tricarboxylate transporter receptor subunit TctC